MSNHFSLFSLSKISIDNLLFFREKKCEKRIENAKFTTKSSDHEDIFTENFKQKMERNKIRLSVNSHSDTLTHFPVFLNKSFIRNKNKTSLSDTIITKKENLHLNQINNKTSSEQGHKINHEIIEENDTDNLIFEMKIKKSLFARKKLTDTKEIWNSIQENIKSIVSSSE